QHLRALAILVSSDRMLSAIEFNDEPLIDTAEIDNVAIDRRLSPELEPAQPLVAELKPKYALRICLCTPQASGSFDVPFHRLDPLTPTLPPPGRGSAPRS